jgi:hypothetical protein
MNSMKPAAAIVGVGAVLPVQGTAKDAPSRFQIPVLVTSDGAKGVRLVSALVDAPVDAVEIGEEVEVEWLAAANTTVPVFRLARES